MTHDIVIITDSVRKVGFDLAGISGVISAESKTDTMTILRWLIREQRVGIIIITDQLLPETDEFQQMMLRSFPAIISVPCSGQDVGLTSSQLLRQFIQRSIGISIEI